MVVKPAFLHGTLGTHVHLELINSRDSIAAAYAVEVAASRSPGGWRFGRAEPEFDAYQRLFIGSTQWPCLVRSNGTGDVLGLTFLVGTDCRTMSGQLVAVRAGEMQKTFHFLAGVGRYINFIFEEINLAGITMVANAASRSACEALIERGAGQRLCNDEMMIRAETWRAAWPNLIRAVAR